MADHEESLTGPDLKQGVPAKDITEGATLLGHADGEPVFLTRCGEKIVAAGARCPHYGGPLNEGLIVGDTIRCPWHHAEFNLCSGEVLRPPALHDIQRWDVVENDGIVVVSGKQESGGVAALNTNESALRANAHAAGSDGIPESVVIIGAGAAGIGAAKTLRKDGYTQPITMIESGPFAPYDRPNLSKDYLAGNAPEEWIPLYPDSFYTENNIELMLNRRVASIDPAAKQVALDDGTTRNFGALLIATGSTPITLNTPAEGQHILYLRTLDDSRAIIKASARAKRAVVIGASFIGLEVAASLRARGLKVTVVAPEDRPLERVVGPELGGVVREIHEQHGVVFQLGRTVAAVGRTDVTLDNGERVQCDLIVAGVGVRPNIDLAVAAGLKTDNGILVNEYLETSVPSIYAAGDVARWPDALTGERIRVEHWIVAECHGQAVAKNMLAGSNGQRQKYDTIPFFWSQHYDVTISYVGHAARWNKLEIDGDLSGHDCAVKYFLAGKVVAEATIGRDRASLEAELGMERRVMALG